MNTSRPPRIAPLLAIVIAAGVAAGCSSRTVVYKEGSQGPVIVDDQKGPPPHAPAYGYRAKHDKDDVVLVYDRKLAVYVVSGYPDCYYTGGQYFRFTGGSWEWSVSINTGWKLVADYHDVPSTLCVKHGRGKSVHKEKDRDKGKSKHKH